MIFCYKEGGGRDKEEEKEERRGKEESVDMSSYWLEQTSLS